VKEEPVLGCNSASAFSFFSSLNDPDFFNRTFFSSPSFFAAPLLSSPSFCLCSLALAPNSAVKFLQAFDSDFEDLVLDSETW